MSERKSWLSEIATAALIGGLGGFAGSVVTEHRVTDEICRRALDRSHTSADTATVYRLGVCMKENK